MLVNGKALCNACAQAIGSSSHVAFKIPLRKGEPQDYDHFHHRFRGDCFDREIRKIRKEDTDAFTAAVSLFGSAPTD